MTAADALLAPPDVVTAVAAQASALCVLAGLVAGAAVLVSVRQPTVALAVALELWTAAGLLRLTGAPTIEAVATAAGVLVVRRLVVVSLHRSVSGGPPESLPRLVLPLPSRKDPSDG